VTDAGAVTAAGSASADLALTMTAVLTNPDQFTFQDDGESGTLPSASTLVASKADASATGAATLDTTAALSGDDQSTAAGDRGWISGYRSHEQRGNEPPASNCRFHQHQLPKLAR
jgi:hypothetical protein